jgi:hypothetical protein
MSAGRCLALLHVAWSAVHTDIACLMQMHKYYTTHFHMLCSGDNPICFILLRCYSGGGGALNKKMVYKEETNC